LDLLEARQVVSRVERLVILGPELVTMRRRERIEDRGRILAGIARSRAPR
jgi:hypothetical protein